MSNTSYLTALVRDVVAQLDRASPGDCQAIVAPLREHVQPNVHVGTKPEGHAAVEWYAGQILDIVDGKHWFAMNSLLNCVDKFVPAPPPIGTGDKP